ncbi:BON domain-containing protein [Vibrio casei]|uniref:BON domain-containing protein n=1 Tax=Vibrio casei TaxID=673372 RepID=UPI00097EC8E3|nr:BON domain-containing protein [Vibrio casei]SJN36464.1 21 kDa hemolysin precursor [Vibrio casei]
MKKNILILVTFLFILNGCAQFQSDKVNQRQWQEKSINSNVDAINHSPQFSGKIRVTSEVNEGAVILIGQATDEETKKNVESYVQTLPGVKKTYNQIRVRPLISFDQISNDVWLTTKVKSAILSEDKLDNYTIKVVTENKEVFLIGSAPPEEAEIAANIARHVAGVNKVVKAFTNKTSDSSSVNSTPATNLNDSSTTQNNPDNIVDDSPMVTDNSGLIIEEPNTLIDESDVSN